MSAPRTLRLRIVSANGARDVEVDVRAPDAAVADLAAAVDVPELYAGARRLDPAIRLCDAPLCDGEVLGTAPAPRAAPAVVALVVDGGLAAGRAVPLPAGSHALGRAAGAAVHVPCRTVSPRHGRVDVSLAGDVAVADLGSVNGTVVDGTPAATPTAGPAGAVVEAGAARLVVARWRP
ncbi:MAG TPA: FHA domain-containing protein, partial [Actinomycetota bacterium]|nr:FHA domain-containing protein [Actinomycetota bacterium]